ncbi:MAG: hypothetical protein AAF573_17295 [Bacteroidota bacterium]
MRGILYLLDARASKAFQRSRKEKEQVENVKSLLNHSLIKSNKSSISLRSKPVFYFHYNKKRRTRSPLSYSPYYHN